MLYAVIHMLFLFSCPFCCPSSVSCYCARIHL
uniref:Uncharacterized protein n=1 Tax=Rhizophora mucronata TaxID=61149 RepID=A0A2P2NBQ3_RHIMU